MESSVDQQEKPGSEIRRDKTIQFRQLNCLVISLPCPLNAYLAVAHLRHLRPAGPESCSLIRVGIEFFVAALFAAEVSPEVSPSSPGQWNEIFFPAGEIRVGDGERSGDSLS